MRKLHRNETAFIAIRFRAAGVCHFLDPALLTLLEEKFARLFSLTALSPVPQSSPLEESLGEARTRHQDHERHVSGLMNDLSDE